MKNMYIQKAFTAHTPRCNKTTQCTLMGVPHARSCALLTQTLTLDTNTTCCTAERQSPAREHPTQDLLEKCRVGTANAETADKISPKKQRFSASVLTKCQNAHPGAYWCPVTGSSSTASMRKVVGNQLRRVPSHVSWLQH